MENLSNTIICTEKDLVLMDSAQKTIQNWRQNLCLCLICTENTNSVCFLTRIGTDSGQIRPRVFVQDKSIPVNPGRCGAVTRVGRLICNQ